MALAMLVGNSNQISVSLFSPANTLAALLANNFPEAGAKQVSVLMYAALVLLGITLRRQHRRHHDHPARGAAARGLRTPTATMMHARPIDVPQRTADRADPFGGVDFSQLERSLRRPRTLIDFLLTATVTGDDAALRWFRCSPWS